MRGIVVQTTALKSVNKGGGIKTKNVYVPEEFEQEVWELGEGPDSRKVPVKKIKKKTFHRKKQVGRKQTGADYVAFNCARCGQRNKRHAYDAKVEEDGKRLAFR